MRGREPMPRNRSVWPVMVMERDSARSTQTAAPHSERFWSSLRLVVFFLVAIGLGAWGYLLGPTAVSPLSVFEPTITILANQQNVTAVVDMTLSLDLGHTPPYSLALTITAIGPSQGTKFTVSFAGFPAPAAGTGHSLHTSDNAYYTQINSASGLSGTSLPSQPFTFTSLRPIGEDSQGAQLRVAFPNLVGEKPGANPSSLACGFAASLVGTYRTICAQLGNRRQWAPSLEAGTTKFSSANPPLGDYQYLAGDNPTLLGTTTWMWSGINGVEVLAASVPAQDNDQNDLFYSGLLLGVAGAAGIASVTELLRPVWRRETDEPKAESTVRSE